MTPSQIPLAKLWLSAFRIKTLPLSLSSTIIGTCLAAHDGCMRWSIFGLLALTTILLQILSNLANDYGDFVNGKDTAERIGPRRMVQSGEISPVLMLRGMMIIGLLCVLSGVSLIILGTQGLSISTFLLFGLLGLGSIAAAIKYTVGKHPYGYSGLGDVFVFFFFGLVGVMGSYFLHTHNFHWELIFPASAIGMLSTGVLNMNNMRDYTSDRNAGKRTLVVLMGTRNAAFYQLFLVGGAALLAVVYTLFHYSSVWQWFFLLSFPLFYIHLRKVFSYENALELYPELSRLSMASLLFALTFGLGLII